MNLSGLLPLLEKTPEFQELLARIRDAASSSQKHTRLVGQCDDGAADATPSSQKHTRLVSQCDDGVAEASLLAQPLDVLDAARPFVLAALQKSLARLDAAARPRPIVVIASRAERAKQLMLDLALWSEKPEQVYFFAEPEPLWYERLPWGIETMALRLAALLALVAPSAPSLPTGVEAVPLIVTTIRALMLRTVPPDIFRRGVFVLRRGASPWPPTATNGERWRGWLELGYEAAPVVDAPGLLSRRGGIVDVWPPSMREPVRIELSGDEIASIRVFDPTTQRSGRILEAVVITPASEVAMAHAPQVAQMVRGWDFSSVHPIAAQTFRQDLDALERLERFRGIEFYLPYFYQETASLLDYLPPAALVVADDWQELEALAQQFEMQAEQVRADLEGRGEIPRNLVKPYFTWEELRVKMMRHPRILFDYRGVEEAPVLPFAPGTRYGGQVKRVVEEMLRLRREERALVVAVSRQAERLADLLRERSFFVKPKTDLTFLPEPGHIVLVQGALTEGFRLQPTATSCVVGTGRRPVPTGASRSTVNLYLLTDAEIFGWSRPKPRRLAAHYTRRQTPEAFFADLVPGDYVVHIDHGIGIFRGLQKLALGGPETEYLLIEYAQGDRLYVPVHQLDRLSRYVAPGGRTPTLHRLGTAEWNQVKERTKKAVAEIAQELLELYATREVITGHAFSEDTAWQRELEASFPYVETTDQLAAIEQVKRDMQQARPMDRLVVGDVGYGKTEVALRAAFKAVMDGKQVAILVPTTVLAQQHYNTFKERLAPFPVNVEMLSRFRSEKEQDEIVKKLAQGAIDIVIGTHRLLSNDVQFKDLGLLIVDEEQRFGVTHKERLKQLRAQVDVLTLTATPIPRTLYLSLSGVRDLSTIETPPEERLPIRTYVAPYDDSLVRDAILRELDRGGQVFFVHNRVQGIGLVAEQLRRLVPEARIAVGHGQMPEEELETVMSEFVAGAHDVLVCTTIIESGIDIPNANTLIVNHADRFGLAQLYQLRGRVGRGAARAYAYFLYDKQANLSEEARKRLQTIAESTDLGAGFQIAMRDLEIRGAGEILGARQSGHIAAVGFDLYCRLLAGAIEEISARLRATNRSLPPDSTNGRRGTGADARVLHAPTIDLPLPSQIPESYIPDGGLRLRLYRRLADVKDEAQIEDLRREFRERFGELPEQVENLFFLLRVKVAATQAQVAAILLDNGRVTVRFREEDAARMEWLNKRFGQRVRASRDRMWLPGPDASSAWQQELIGVLRELATKRIGV